MERFADLQINKKKRKENAIAHFKIIDTNVFTCSSLIIECIVTKIKTCEFKKKRIVKKRLFFL